MASSSAATATSGAGPSGSSRKDYKCDCQLGCGGNLRKVSKTTFYEHAIFRQQALSNAISNAMGRSVGEGHGGQPAKRRKARKRRQRKPSRRATRSPGRADPESDPGPLPFQDADDDMFGSPPQSPLPHEPSPDPDEEDDRDNEPDPDGEEPWHERNGAPAEIHLDHLRRAQQYVEALKNATLEGSGLDEESIHRLRHPPTTLPDLDEDTRLRLMLRHYIDNGHCHETFKRNRRSAMEYDPNLELPGIETVRKAVQDLTGIVPITTHMCPDTCIAYTGPYAELDHCPFCHSPRFEIVDGKSRPRQTFDTLPFGPQVQAIYRTRDNAELMGHRKRALAAFEEMLDAGENATTVDDTYFSTDFLDAVESGLIETDDLVLMFSVDGAQLYASKQSDCWIYIWILFDISPDHRYKKRFVLPGAIIPGPNKPKDLDSFLLVGLLHIAALQKEGLRIWDAAQDRVFVSKPVIIFATADTVAMAYLNGLVGHGGGYGCRLFCGMKGRRKPRKGHYYMAMLKPHNYNVANCNHDDYSARAPPPVESNVDRYKRLLESLLSVTNQTQYERRRLATGIGKPSIFSGLPKSFGIPTCFPADIMHHLALNVTELMIGLLRGTFKCSCSDSVDDWPWACYHCRELWEKHGKIIEELARYLPGSFDRPPRNPAEKISSGYKAWEFLYYFYGVLPAYLWVDLDPVYFDHICKLIAGARFALLVVTPIHLRPHYHKLLVEFVEDFERLYYQRRLDRLHFCRHSIHLLLHMIPEGIRLGPAWLNSQWALENAIGNLTREIASDVRPFADLNQIMIRRAHLNALYSMFPDLTEATGPPPNSADIGEGYVMLRYGLDRSKRRVDNVREAEAILRLLEGLGLDVPVGWTPLVQKWPRILLPNGQIARTAWREMRGEGRGRPVRRARMVKLKDNRFAEVQYYFRLSYDDAEDIELHLNVAMVSFFTPPDPAILEESHGCVMACHFLGDESREVINIKEIASVVGMVPMPMRPHERAEPDAHARFGSRFFVVEKLGFDMSWIGRQENPRDAEDDMGDGAAGEGGPGM